MKNMKIFQIISEIKKNLFWKSFQINKWKLTSILYLKILDMKEVLY